MYKAKELADYLSFDSVPSSWEHCLEDAWNLYSPNWLERMNFKEIMEFYDLEEPLQARILAELHLLNSDQRLNFVCWLWHYILFYASSEDCDDIWTWDSHSKAFSTHGSPMMAVVVILSGSRLHRNNMEKFHFEPEQVSMQKYGIRYYCGWDMKKHGTDGMRFRQMIFASGLITGLMTWHGRLQFEWIPEGFAPLDPFFPDRPPAVFIHIPEDGPLDEPSVSAALKSALAHIPGYYDFPAGHPPVFFTQSWLLSPQLKEFLPADSRILRFQKYFEILDTQPCPDDFLYFIFDLTHTPECLENLPGQTLLQREIKKRMIAGASLDRGLGVLKEV